MLRDVVWCCVVVWRRVMGCVDVWCDVVPWYVVCVCMWGYVMLCIVRCCALLCGGILWRMVMYVAVCCMLCVQGVVR